MDRRSAWAARASVRVSLVPLSRANAGSGCLPRRAARLLASCPRSLDPTGVNGVWGRLESSNNPGPGRSLAEIRRGRFPERGAVGPATFGQSGRGRPPPTAPRRGLRGRTPTPHGAGRCRRLFDPVRRAKPWRVRRIGKGLRSRSNPTGRSRANPSPCRDVRQVRAPPRPGSRGGSLRTLRARSG